MSVTSMTSSARPCFRGRACTDELYAVWDGKPVRAYGGTADVVAYARERGTPVRVIWPDGAQRD
jgi:hypothetical protein